MRGPTVSRATLHSTVAHADTNMKTPSIDRIECPKCGAQIPLTQTLNEQLAEQIRKELEKKFATEKKRFDAASSDLAEREAALAKDRKSLDGKVQDLLKAERAKLMEEATKKAREDLGVEMRDVRSELEEKSRKLREAQDTELDLRKRERGLEDAKKEMELEVERRLAKEKKQVQEAVTKQILESQRLKEAEKDKVIQDLTTQLEIAHHKAQQGSQQLQGEVLELDLESFLKESFPFDEIVPVAKGVRGADVLQRVLTRSGLLCGSILWESKRTKNWSEGWIDKLKDDQRNEKAEIAALVTEVLPRDIQSFGQRESVWVTNRACVFPLALVLRSMVEQVALARNAAEHKDGMMEMLYKYLAGPEFRQRVEAVVDAHRDMREDLEKEKRSTMTRWARHDKYLERAMQGVAGMTGDLRGLLGSSMPTIPALEAGGTEDAQITLDAKAIPEGNDDNTQ